MTSHYILTDAISIVSAQLSAPYNVQQGEDSL